MQKIYYCYKKRDSDPLGGVKIQIAGDPNLYGYPHYQSLRAMPSELRPLFEDRTGGTSLWPEFWMDVSAMQRKYTPINCFLGGGSFLGVVVLWVGAAMKNVIVASVGFALMIIFFCAITIAQGLDTFVPDLNEMMESKYNAPHFRPKGWMAQCHIERGAPTRYGQAKLWIIHFFAVPEKVDATGNVGSEWGQGSQINNGADASPGEFV